MTAPDAARRSWKPWFIGGGILLVLLLAAYVVLPRFLFHYMSHPTGTAAERYVAEKPDATMNHYDHSGALRAHIDDVESWRRARSFWREVDAVLPRGPRVHRAITRCSLPVFVPGTAPREAVRLFLFRPGLDGVLYDGDGGRYRYHHPLPAAVETYLGAEPPSGP